MLSLSASEGGGVTGGGGGEFRTVKVGYEDIDTGMNMGLWRQGGGEGEEEPWRPVMVGRRSFGKFNRALEVRIFFYTYTKSQCEPGNPSSERS